MFTHSSAGFTRLSAGVVVIITGALALSGCDLIPGSGPTSPATPEATVGTSAPADYGYYGSTPENTTQSSGTGGKTQLSVEALPKDQVHCQDLGDAGWEFTIDGQPAMAKGVAQWFTQQTGKPQCAETVTKDIAIVSWGATTATPPYWIGGDGAISASGAVMTLSDFFYDSANYIDYINRTLFDKAANPRYADWLAGADEGRPDRVPPTSFTGLPNDYPYFSAIVGDAGLILSFTFPDGNPFFPATSRESGTPPFSSSETTIDLGIPADLSPFGRIATITWKTAGATTYPEVVTNTTDASVDAKINGLIKAAVDAHPDLPCFEVSAGKGRLALIGFQAPSCLQGEERKTAMLHLAGQWRFGTWADDPMTAADLPADWRTVRAEGGGPTIAGALVCPANRKTDESCEHLTDQADIPPFSNQAKVQGVWLGLGNRPTAVITDGDKDYLLSY